MILYIENPKDAARKLLELINELSKVAGYKINIQKSVAFLYTINERSEREIKETVSFTITSKWIKYLGINLPKEAKNPNRWKDIPCSWIGRINIVKMTILLKEIYRFNAIPIRIQMALFTELEKIILNLYGNTKEPE